MRRKTFDLSEVLSTQEVGNLNSVFNTAKITIERVAVSLSNEDRRNARNVAHRREAYVRGLARIAPNFERVLPRDIEPATIGKLVEQYEAHKTLKVLLDEIKELNDDTIVAIGSAIMKEADSIYPALQRGRKRDGALDLAMAEIEEYYKRSTEDDSTNPALGNTPPAV